MSTLSFLIRVETTCTTHSCELTIKTKAQSYQTMFSKYAVLFFTSAFFNPSLIISRLKLDTCNSEMGVLLEKY